MADLLLIAAASDAVREIGRRDGVELHTVAAV
jgi:hypothetical protein